MKDQKVFGLIAKEAARQRDSITLIPSENYVSKEIRQAVGSVLCNKYSEGYPGKKYYQGNGIIEQIESLAIERVKKLFKVPYANVQPYSGAIANSAVYYALLEPGDTIMGMSLPSGGHLTHGHPNITFSGKYFKSIQYGTDENGFIDYASLEKLAIKNKPKIIISGTSAYSRKIDFKRIGEIANKVGAWHLADISHISGLVAAGEHQSPVKYAHIVMTTTHKSLRGPRGAILMATNKGLKKDPEMGNKLDKAVFPGLQGGPHMHTIAGIAVCLKEASTSSFHTYAKQIIKNSMALADELKKSGFNILTGGTDNHLFLVDMSGKGTDGWVMAWALEYAGITVNRNSIPFEKGSPFYPSGIRIGTPAVTTRGMKEKEMKKIAGWVDQTARIVQKLDLDTKERSKVKESLKNNRELRAINKQVAEFCKKFPTP